MDPVSVIGIVQTCFTLGPEVIKICKNWKEAGKEVEQRILIVESCWDRTRRQVDFMLHIESAIDDELLRILDGLLGQLCISLTDAKNKLETVTKRESLSRPGFLSFRSKAKNASWVWKKEAIDDIIAELEAWQRRFDPSWFLLMRITSPTIDSELLSARKKGLGLEGSVIASNNPLALAAGLRNVLSPDLSKFKSLFLPESPMEWCDIPYTGIKLARRTSGSDNKWYVIDRIDVRSGAKVRDVMRDVRVLSARLSKSDPLVFGLLSCKGVIGIPRSNTPPEPTKCFESQQTSSLPLRSRSPRLDMSGDHSLHKPSASQHDYSCFQIVLRVPHGMNQLQSLRQILLASGEEPSLSRKVRIARELAKAVSYVHTFAFVHKNIRPESILCFEDAKSSQSHAFLAGFDAFRASDAGTMMAGDLSWEKNVYRHPLRQGEDPTETFNMQHDIYSLGVCLLEIGLWESFVEYDCERPDRGPYLAKFGKTYHRFRAYSKSKTPNNHAIKASSFLDLAFSLKDFLVNEASTKLAPRVGDRYMRVVVSCLTCLDEDNLNPGEPGDDTEDLVAIRFIGTILKDLDDIRV
ncbi:hypothetical protein PFICI_08768 [Pestalotiopsis fici W106-1]|uniref:Protein kinase domain-containing protein n=1 Tax=Pestalotiopsis fici (strain W106-1 / CGMCC3.15140) TaxID=1229662 RepID=W3WYJ2_PESFW|nr:uncharacterized protein PFICI_08768 [Pestalotiopsis fici W106-1]ETS78915.1 hypothetical protein PFICI_08768 [Pestalotiopsis fici W106-1]